MNLKFSLLLLVFPLLCFSQSNLDNAIQKYNSNSVEYISVEDLIQLKNSSENVKLLDTREPSEYSISHLQGAIYAGYNDFSLQRIQNIINTEDIIVVYCSIGVRSEQIGEQLLQAGYPNVYNLYGGIFDWVNKDQKVYDHKGNPTDKVHAYDRFWGNYLEKGQKVY